MNIQLKYQEENKLYFPLTEADKFLMQHVMNEDLSALNAHGLDKARYVAAAHDWHIEIL